jgi:hypothetical protein
MVGFPCIPLALDALAFKFHLTESFISAENSQTLLTRKQALVILQSDIGDSFEKLPQHEILPPFGRIFSICTVACAFLVG